MLGDRHRIAVLRALQLGDMLCAIPVMRSMRAAYPDSQITLIGLPWAGELKTRFPGLVDEVVGFPGWPGIPEAPFDPARSLAFIAESQARSYDLAIQLQGSGLTSTAFVQLLGAGQTAGFHPPGLPGPGPGWTPYFGHGHESRRLLVLARHLGWPEAGDEVTFPLLQEDWDEYEGLSGELGLRAGEYAVVHAGARDESRCWPASKFVAVADALGRAGLRIVLTGVESERAQVEGVASEMAEAPVIVCGRTSLGALGCLLDQARLLVSNDTGVAHIAAALDVPRVVVFTHSDPDRWATTDSGRNRSFIEPSALTNACCEGASHRCLADSCRLMPPRLTSEVRIESVIDAALELCTGVSAHAERV